MKPIVIAALISVVLAACASSPPTVPAQSQAATAATKPIQIISDPPGARIEVNDDYVGDAPLTITVQEENGNFANVTTIRAIPTRDKGTMCNQNIFPLGSTGARPSLRASFSAWA